MSWGTILQGVGSVLGGGAGIAGMFGGGSSNKWQKKGYKLARDQFQFGQEQWRQMLKGKWRDDTLAQRNYNTRIRTLVKDANAAGIHPLAALGANLGSGPIAQPVGGASGGGGFSGGGEYAGDAIGSGMAAIGDAFGNLGQTFEADQDRQDAQEAKEYQRQLDLDVKADRMFQNRRQAVQDNQALKESEARIRESDANILESSARTRSILASMRNAALGATTAAPSTIKNPYSGTWGLAPGTSSAQDAQALLGEPGEWLNSAEQFLWNLLNDPDSRFRLNLVPGPASRGKAGNAPRAYPK